MTSITVRRNVVNATDLKLPECPLPRPGETVVWHNDAFQRRGIYVGHAPEAKPIIRTNDGVDVTLNNFDEIRLLTPLARQNPVWHSLPKGSIVKPYATESATFRKLLSTAIPPGVTYFEVIEEIWSRGFEVFLVGGTVRDVLGGDQANDVDLVTSIPLSRATPFLARMFRKDPEIDEENGFVRLGGPIKDGAPSIDLKSLVYRAPGSPEAVFACDINRDMKHRDFACNAVYYDPINDALLDPSGVGIQTAESKELAIVCDATMRPRFFLGTIAIRFAKFRVRGFTYSGETAETLKSTFLPQLSTMSESNILSYFKRQVFGKTEGQPEGEIVEQFATVFEELGSADLWHSRVAPALARRRKKS